MNSRALKTRHGSKTTVIGALRLNPSTRSIEINADKLPRPNKVYDADVAWLQHAPGDVRLFFGKYGTPNFQRFRSRVEVRYPIEAFYRHFWEYSREFHRALSERPHPPPRPGQPARSKLEHLEYDKDYSEWANFDLMAHTGTEASIEFFHLPTVPLTSFIRTGSMASLEVESAVRVQLTTIELKSLLDQCASAIDSVKQDLLMVETPQE